MQRKNLTCLLPPSNRGFYANTIVLCANRDWLGAFAFQSRVQGRHSTQGQPEDATTIKARKAPAGVRLRGLHSALQDAAWDRRPRIETGENQMNRSNLTAYQEAYLRAIEIYMSTSGKEKLFPGPSSAAREAIEFKNEILGDLFGSDFDSNAGTFVPESEGK